MTKIEESTFYGCTGLTYVNLPNVTTIEKCAFGNRTYIGASKTDGCLNLKSIYMPNVSYIGDRAFSGCEKLSVTIPSSLTRIGKDALQDVAKVFWLGNTPPTGYSETYAKLNYVSNDSYRFSGNNSITKLYPFLSSKFVVDGIVYVPVSPSDRTCDVIDYEYNPDLKYLIISDKVINKGIEMTVNNICDYSFYGNEDIQTVRLSNNGDLGESAFQGCRNLISISLNQDITTIGKSAFSGCESLSAISIPGGLNRIKDNVFNGCSSLTNVIFENGTEKLSLGYYYQNSKSGPLFVDCPLENVYIGRKLDYYTSPFKGNTSLSAVEIPDQETTIYDEEFYGCTNLSSLIIGDGVKTIGRRAFSGCSKLEYFSIGSQVESIGNEAFSDCTGLTKFYSYATIPPTCGSQALDDINKWSCTLYVPTENADEYKAAEQWKEFFFVEEMIPVNNIKLDRENAVMYIDDSFQINVAFEPSNATNQGVTYMSSDPTVAVVSRTGMVTAVKAGEAVITVRSVDGEAEATCAIHVNEGAGVEDVANDCEYQLIATSNGLVISNAVGAIVEVYTIDGKMIKSICNYDGDELYLDHGLYIVRANTQVWKVKL